ncbi:rust resistance kinase Lr10-like [Henckelia pumila]|uniref:rust resistance kinase Lr10-like n=1 Tax=Henckelia pumila TaxID=405737 RepID=UPI003C6DEFBA
MGLPDMTRADTDLGIGGVTPKTLSAPLDLAVACADFIDTRSDLLYKGIGGSILPDQTRRKKSTSSVSFFPLFGAGIDDDCLPIRCRKHGPKIQFPFRHKYLQPQHCGYGPGFDLYCDHEKNETVIELPFSAKVMVQEIDYQLQTVHIYDPERCLLQKMLNLSASPFQLLNYYPLSDYILFNCSASQSYLSQNIPCYSDSKHQAFAVSIDSFANDYPYLLISCTKLHQISSVSWDMIYGQDLTLNWSKPACGHCESQGKLCSFKNYTRGHHHFKYVNKPADTKNDRSNTARMAGATLGSFLSALILAALYLLYSSIRTNKENQEKIENFLEDYRALKPTRFSYADVRKMTNEFGEKLGQGSYGIVYKGILSSEISVAVKVLHNFQGNGEEFINEVGTIGKIHHVNVVRLVGFCADGFKRALIYQFLPNESLEKFIFQEGRKKNPLGLMRLQDIALGIAKGIEYLHEGCDKQILHFDIKPHNILLDGNFNPKICDFGLAKLCSKEQSAVSMTAARGTMGYIAPEMLSRTFGRVSYKSDVYSFGMLLLEMVGGRKNVDHSVNNSQMYFPQWIYDHLNQGDDILMHAEEEGDESKVARKLTIVGLWCIQWYPADRPSMKAVAQMLERDRDNLVMPPNPFPLTNDTNSVARIPGRRYQYQPELEIISETK